MKCEIAFIDSWYLIRRRHRFACEWSLYPHLYSGEQKGEIISSQPTNQQLPEQQSPPPSQEPRNLLHEVGAADGVAGGAEDGVDDPPSLLPGEDVAGVHDRDAAVAQS